MILFLHDQAESNATSLMIHVEEFSLKEKAQVPTYSIYLTKLNFFQYSKV